MSDVWIVNASPLITLAKIDRLDLLEGLAPAILVPAEVRLEVLAGPHNDPARRALESGWGQAVAAAQIAPDVLEWDLGAGETEVIAVALERPGAGVILDDARARACASSFSLPLVGTIGVVMRARHRGVIPVAAPVLAALEAAGLRIDRRMIEKALSGFGETWPGSF